MSTENVAPVGGAMPVAPVSPPASEGPLTIREAATALAQRREEQNKQPAKTRAPDGKFAALPAKEDAAPKAVVSDAPDESQISVESDPPQDDPAAIEPPTIDPPRSWTNEEKEAFAALPPEHQQRIADRERARELEIRKGHDAVAEARKAADAVKGEAEKARLQYEQALPQLLQVLQVQHSGEFGDIKTFDDVRKMAEEDPFRYAKWDAQQKQLQLVHNEVVTTQQRQQHERKEQFKTWADEQDAEFRKLAPEFADEAKSKQARQQASEYLTKVLKVPEADLGKLWNGEETISLRALPVQLALRDAAKWHFAQQQARAAVAKPLPPVQRPGTAPSRNDASANIQALQSKLDRATTLNEQVRAAAALRAAKRAAAR